MYLRNIMKVLAKAIQRFSVILLTFKIKTVHGSVSRNKKYFRGVQIKRCKPS